MCVVEMICIPGNIPLNDLMPNMEALILKA